MTPEKVFFFGVLGILLLRIIFRASRVEGMVSCSGLYLYDYDGDDTEHSGYDNGDSDIDTDCYRKSTGELVCTSTYGTSAIDTAAVDEYNIPAETCVEGDDGKWEWKPCSASCGSGKQLYEFVRSEGSYCTLPTTCKLGDGNCVTNCTDYSADSCSPP